MRNMLPHGSLRRAVRQHGEKRGNDMADFIKGMDLSTLLEVEACGRKDEKHVDENVQDFVHG